MMIQQIVARYESGVITAHEMVVDCLSLIDPGHPAAVLDQIPLRTLPLLAEFLDGFRPEEMRSLQGKMIPTEGQVLAAKGWLDPTRGPALVPSADDQDQRKG